MYESIINFFQENKSESDFLLKLNYLSGMQEVYGKVINSGRDGESFSEEEKEALKSFGDDELSKYADNPVVLRKKMKNPYRPNSNMNRLIKYTETTIKWHPYNIEDFIVEKKRENEAIKNYIDSNPDLISEYRNAHKGFDEKFNQYKQSDGNQDKTINGYIFYLLTEVKGFERREGFERIEGTPIKVKDDKYILSTYIKKDEIEYFPDRSRYFVVSFDGKGLKEISKEQAVYVSMLFKSPDTPKKTDITENVLEKYAKSIKKERFGIWCDYSLEQMVRLELECKTSDDQPIGIDYYNRPVVRISKAVENKTLSKPEIRTELGLFSSYFEKYKNA